MIKPIEYLESYIKSAAQCQCLSVTKLFIALIETIKYYVFSTYENISYWKHVTEDWLKMHCYLWKQSGIAEIWCLSSLTCYHWQWFIPCCCWCQSSCPLATHSPTGKPPWKMWQNLYWSVWTFFSDLGKGERKSKKAITLCCPVSVNNIFFKLFSPFLLLEGKSTVTPTLSWACFFDHTFTRKGIGFAKECMDEHILIYFSLRVCDALLICHQSGRLPPNKDQGKLMSLCRAKAELV